MKSIIETILLTTLNLIVLIVLLGVMLLLVAVSGVVVITTLCGVYIYNNVSEFMGKLKCDCE